MTRHDASLWLSLTSIISVSAGPLSGIFRILDSPRAMKRIQDQEKGPREKKPEVKPVTPVAPQVTQVKSTTVQPVRRPPSAGRQQSEDDEIARIKRENKAAGSSTTETETRAASILKKPAEETEVSQVELPLSTLPNVSDPFVCVFSSAFVALFRRVFLERANASRIGRPLEQRKFIRRVIGIAKARRGGADQDEASCCGRFTASRRGEKAISVEVSAVAVPARRRRPQAQGGIVVRGGVKLRRGIRDRRGDEGEVRRDHHASPSLSFHGTRVIDSDWNPQRHRCVRHPSQLARRNHVANHSIALRAASQHLRHTHAHHNILLRAGRAQVSRVECR